MNHADAKFRRKAIVRDIKDGDSTVEVAARYSVSPTTVWAACAEYGVSIPRKGGKGSKPRTFRILRALWDGAKVKDVAERFNVSEVFVFKVKADAAANGWPELKGKSL